MSLRVEIPHDPRERRTFLAGMNDAQRGIKPDASDSRRPALEPFASIYDRGHLIGSTMLETENAVRLPRLREGIRFKDAAAMARAEKEARKSKLVMPWRLGKDDGIESRGKKHIIVP